MKYEVIKLKTGQEFCGMVSYTEATIEVTLPMICQLTRVSQANTLATFIPYAPLALDPILSIGLESVMHTSPMNDQFIPFYDEASAKWLGMVEDGNIPLTNSMPSPKEFLREKLDEIMEGVSEEELQQIEREAFAEEDYVFSVTSDDEKIIH
jgi:hypothetical protein|tara:strand:+ start:11167 stop:11622 length:456 start_codon:yes stop_codon:yes gene_type:complete